MRRALALASSVLLGLSVASPPAAAEEAPIREPEFQLHADGFLVTLKGESDGAHVVLTLFRHGQTAYYETAAQITENSVKARFGRFGELDYTFAPAAGGQPKCGGTKGTSEGTFSGTFDFSGENDYVRFEAAHAHGILKLFPDGECKKPPIAARRAAARREDKEDEVTLQATSGGRRRTDFLLAFTLQTKKGPRLIVTGFREEMLVERGVLTIARASALQWDLKAGTARLTPPAPFQGTAEFKRRPHGKPVWRGSLRAPLLGGGTLPLAGGRFRASLGTGSILD
jgi:hypothetical protein